MSGKQNYFALTPDFDSRATVSRQPGCDPLGERGCGRCSQHHRQSCPEVLSVGPFSLAIYDDARVYVAQRFSESAREPIAFGGGGIRKSNNQRTGRHCASSQGLPLGARSLSSLKTNETTPK